MSAVTMYIDDREMLLGIDGAQATLADVTPMLNIAGALMLGSIARTFREEGSPAGSWPKLAASTMRKKGYTTGHKLLILSGLLFGSIHYVVSSQTVQIGTNLVYAAVQQFGSADRGSVYGPRTAEMHAATVNVAAFSSSRASFNRRGVRNGRSTRYRGPANQTHFEVSAHTRHQNIPARPYVVFRPEDPGRIMQGFEAYLAGKLVRIGKVTTSGSEVYLSNNLSSAYLMGRG